MLKNRPFLMVLTGAGLALLLWLAVLAFQDNSAKPNANNNSAATNAIPEEYTIMPAGVLSVVEVNEKIIVSGLGTANAGVSLSSNSVSFANSKVDAEGNWVLSVPITDLSESTMFDLTMVTPDGHQVHSDQSLYYIKRDLSESLILLTKPGEHSRVLKSPFGQLPAVEGFELESIDYDNSGGVIFSGSSVTPGKVRIYANDNKVGESRVDRNGRWTLIFGSIMPLGEYNISAEFEPDNQSGAVRLTLPFSRIEPLFEAEGSPKLLVQQLDERLQIARALYGGGYQFTVIYSAEAAIE